MNEQKVKKLTKAEQKKMFLRLSRGSEWVNPFMKKLGCQE